MYIYHITSAFSPKPAEVIPDILTCASLLRNGKENFLYRAEDNEKDTQKMGGRRLHNMELQVILLYTMDGNV